MVKVKETTEVKNMDTMDMKKTDHLFSQLQLLSQDALVDYVVALKKEENAEHANVEEEEMELKDQSLKK